MSAVVFSLFLKFLGALYMSPERLHILVNEFVLRWNVRAGIKNLGRPDFGMFEIEILSELHDLVSPYVGEGGGKWIEQHPIRTM
jgi:hypothetical protein